MARYTFRGRDSGAPAGPPQYVKWSGNSLSAPYPGSPPFGGPIVEKVVVRDSGGGGGAAYGPTSARPVASGTSMVFYATDTALAYLDDPVTQSWVLVAYGAANGVSPPGLVGSWTPVGSLDLTNLGDILHVAAKTANVDHHIMRTWPVGVSAPAPGGPWVLTTSLLPFFQANSTYPGIGVCVSNGITPGVSGMVFCGTYNFSGNALSFGAWPSVINSQSRPWGQGFGTNSALFNGRNVTWFRIVCDGVNYHNMHSANGVNWTLGASVTMAAGPAVTTPTHYGLTCGCVNGSGLANAFVYSLGLNQRSQVNVSNIVYGLPNLTVTTSAPHGLITGDQVSISAVVATGTSPNAVYVPVTVTSPTTFTVTALGGMTYTSGGKVTLLSR